MAIAGNSSDPVDYSFTVTDNSIAPIQNTGLFVVESGTLAAGETIDYTFTANAGTQIFFDGRGSNWQVRSGLLDSEGNNIVL